MQEQDIGVKHWHNGDQTWKLGVSGFFTRIRGGYFASFFISLAAAIPFAGKTLWWTGSIPKEIHIATNVVVLSSLLIFLTIFWGGFLYLRFRVQRSLKIKSELHNLVHESRDDICQLQKRIMLYSNSLQLSDYQNEKQRLEQYSDKICGIIANYFIELIGDKTIGVAIRMAASNPKKNDEVFYVTIGRAKLSKGRSQTTTAIPKSSGIPKFFMSDDKACEGVLYYHDLEKATLNKVYEMTPNDEIFKNDIKTLIVAPICGWNGEKKDLIGLFFITSKTNTIMPPIHVDLINFTADCLSIIYTCMLFKLEKSGFSKDGLITEQ